MSPRNTRVESLTFVFNIYFRLCTSFFFVTAPAGGRDSIPPSLPAHMLPTHTYEDEMEVEEGIAGPVELETMEVKSTYEDLRDARVAELAKMIKPVEVASNDL
jgi:hypothetical protein